MPLISLRIPQLGEGLQEALLVEFLKKPGDTVKRDEPIYVMETDKATTDVESPYAGKLVNWTVETGSVLQIGTEIAKMEVAEGVKEIPVGHGSAPPSSGATAQSTLVAETQMAVGDRPARQSSTVQIPPRTRKYLKEKGLLEIADKIPTTGKKLMPEDVDAFIAAGGSAEVAIPQTVPNELVDTEQYQVRRLPPSQVVLNYRLVRGAQVCVPVTVMTEIDWTALEKVRQATKSDGGPTTFAMACWCTVRAIAKHDKFRSVLSSDGKALKVFRHVNLGVATALPGDEMLTAVIRQADSMNQAEFFKAFSEQIDIARGGKDQADESTTLTVSNIGKAGMRIGIPAIVAPAVATLAIGEAYPAAIPDGDSVRFRTSTMAVLCFDHRIANGVGAANFLSDLKSQIESFQYDG